MKKFVKGGNPYLPMWEHVPDGEPRVFTHNGETRVYVYGSHDSHRNKYCGEDYVAWSAPVDDLNDWRFEGEIYRAKPGNTLYAPDVVKKEDTYYLYIAMYEGNQIWVAESKSPVGPFENLRKTDFGFDIGVLVDDDNRCYAYWGFKKCYGCEINDDMATIKEGTLHVNMIPHCGFRDNVWDIDNIDDDFSYFEAASIRKVQGKYVFVYSKRDMKGEPSIHRKPNVNSYLDYAYSNHPLEGWVHGGTVSANDGDVIFRNGDFKRAYMKCNNHGSICEINGQWYIFYHRRTGTSEFSRQAMLEPIEVALNAQGQVFMGRVIYDMKGEPVSATEAEMTSQGAYRNGLPADQIIAAGRTCYIDSEDDTDRAYVLPVYDENSQSAPVVNMKGRTAVGFKYVNFGEGGLENFIIRAKAECGDIYAAVYLDAPDKGQSAKGTIVASGVIPAADTYEEQSFRLQQVVTGRHGVYITFISDEGIGSFDWFTFA